MSPQILQAEDLMTDEILKQEVRSVKCNIQFSKKAHGIIPAAWYESWDQSGYQQ
ncbi:MAG: hypothetical protein WDO19_09745 [Bacteroidota bacterium]